MLANAVYGLGAGAKRLLLAGLPLIVAALCALLAVLLRADERETVTLVHTFPLMMENILLSLVLTVGGALLFDLCEKESEGKI